MSWTPVLDGELAVRGWHAVDAIEASLEGATSDPAGLALFWAYASGARERSVADRAREAAIDRLLRELAGPRTRRVGLLGGLCESAWVAHHVTDGIDDSLEAIDRLLAELLAREPWDDHVDLVSGLSGLAVYLFDRGAIASLQQVVTHLDATCRRSEAGVTWYTPWERLDDHQRAVLPDGLCELGLAHGVPGILAALCRVAPVVPEAATLRDDAIRWLLAQRLGDAGFPSYLGSSPARTAWCYGDPGVSLALWHAGVTPNFAWMTRANTGVTDAHLCHGAAGLAHICNRFYQATGDPAHLAAARAWFDRTLAYPHEGTSLLTGAPGVGLALLAALTDVEPAWDGLLLCDVKARR